MRIRLASLAGLAFLFCLILYGCRGGGPTVPQEVTDVLPIGEKRPLEVMLAAPQGSLDSLDDATNVVVSFNQPMVPLQPLPAQEETGPMVIEPKVAGRYRWKGTATLVFEPSEPLPYSTRFKVTVPKGTKSWAQQGLKEDYKFEFVTPIPKLTTSVPADGNSVAGPSSLVFLRFNQPMDPEVARKHLSFFRVEKTQVPVSFTVRTAKPEDLQQELKQAVNEGRASDEYDYSEPDPDASPSPAPPADMVLVLAPDKPLELDRAYKVVLAKGLKGKQGDQATAEETTIDFSTYGPLKLLEAQLDDPEGSLHLQFSNPVSESEVRKALKVTDGSGKKVDVPASEPDEYPGRDVYVSLDWKPNTEYTIVLDKSFKDRYGSSLPAAETKKLKTSHYRADLAMPEGLGVLERLGPLRVPLGLRNVSRAEVALQKVSVDGLIPYLTKSRFPEGSKQVLQAPGMTDRMEERFVDLKSIGSGFVALKVTTDDKSLYGDAFVTITNLGLTGKFSPENIVIFASTLHDARPAAGVEIELRSEDNKVLDSKRTGEDGTVQFPGWAGYGLKRKEYSEPQVWVFARQGEDQAFIRSNDSTGISPWDFNISYSWDQYARNFQAHAFTERGLYKAGEKVQLKGTIRELKSGHWQLPDLAGLSYKVYDSRDEEFDSGRVTLNDFGSFNQTLQLKPDSPTGSWRVQYSLPGAVKDQAGSSVVASAEFRVEAFRPAQFEVTVKADQPHFTAGDKATATVKGWWLFGAPMPGAKLEWNSRLEPANPQPKGYDGWDFGPSSWLRDDHARDESKKLAGDQTKLDDKGLKTLEVSLADFPYQGSGELVLEGTVTSSGRQQISGRTSVTVYRGEYQVGVRPASSFLPTGKPVAVEVVAVTPKDEALQGQSVKLELIRREWNSVRKAEAGGRYRWVTENKDVTVGSQDVRTATQPVKVEVTPDKPGFYILRATSTDSRKNPIVTTSSFYCWGSGYVPWARHDTDIIDLVADKKSYKPGETARILVKSPYEKATALLTLEREHIISRKVIEVDGSASTIEIPIESDHLPNVYVSVMLFAGRLPDKGFAEDGFDLGKPSFKIGYVNLPVETGEKRLNVKVSTDKPSYRPGEEVTVTLECLGHTGKGVASEISLSAADKGVLNLIGYETPDYFDTFYGPRSLSVRTAELRTGVIGQRAFGVKGASAGGGGSEGLDYRENFEFTAYWNPSILTDANGKATVKFKVPDNLTTFRLMATAQTKGSEFGKGEADLVVNKPLMLLPSLPGFARINDDFSAGVTVHNNGSADTAVTVTCEAKGLELAGEPKQSVSVGAGKEQEVVFHYKAPKVGAAELAFTATGGDQTDAVKFKLPVMLPVATETVASNGHTTASQTVELVVPQGMVAGTGVLRVNLAATAVVGLDSAIAYLLEYPYGCLEQQMSRVLPILSAQDLVAALDIPNFPKDKLREKVTEVFANLASYQTSGGGFCIWPLQEGRDQHTSQYLTAYVLYGLAKAKAQGYEVDEKIVNKARGFLKEVLNGAESDYPYSEDERLTSKAFAMYALSLWQFNDVSYLNNLYNNRSKLPLMGKAYLLLAARQLKAEASLVKTLEQEVTSKVRVENATAYFPEGRSSYLGWCYGTQNQTTALCMEAILATKGAEVLAPKVVTWLMENRDRAGHWGDTHDDAAVMQALAAYVGVFEKVVPNFTVTAKLGTQEVLKETFKGRDLKVRGKTMPLDDKLAKVPLQLDKQGEGRLYYQTRMTYAPADPNAKARDEGLAVFKSLSVPADGKRPQEFKAGETYKVSLTVVSPHDRRFVVVNDAVPAGFEVVQTTFETESDSVRSMLKNSWWDFSHIENYDDRVLLFADWFGAGEHSYEYLVRAMHKGTYQMPGTKAEDMYHPEVFGTTAPRTVVIR